VRQPDRLEVAIISVHSNHINSRGTESTEGCVLEKESRWCKKKAEVSKENMNIRFAEIKKFKGSVLQGTYEYSFLKN